MPEELVISALQRAFWVQPPVPSLIVHSDRGGQYVGNVYKALLRDVKAQRSQAAAPSVTTMRRPKAAGRASKRSCPNAATPRLAHLC